MAETGSGNVNFNDATQEILDFLTVINAAPEIVNNFKQGVDILNGIQVQVSGLEQTTATLKEFTTALKNNQALKNKVSKKAGSVSHKDKPSISSVSEIPSDDSLLKGLEGVLSRYEADGKAIKAFLKARNSYDSAIAKEVKTERQKKAVDNKRLKVEESEKKADSSIVKNEQLNKEISSIVNAFNRLQQLSASIAELKNSLNETRTKKKAKGQGRDDKIDPLDSKGIEDKILRELKKKENSDFNNIIENIKNSDFDKKLELARSLRDGGTTGNTAEKYTDFQTLFRQFFIAQKINTLASKNGYQELKQSSFSDDDIKALKAAFESGDGLATERKSGFVDTISVLEKLASGKLKKEKLSPDQIDSLSKAGLGDNSKGSVSRESLRDITEQIDSLKTLSKSSDEGIKTVLDKITQMKVEAQTVYLSGKEILGGGQKNGKKNGIEYGGFNITHVEDAIKGYGNGALTMTGKGELILGDKKDILAWINDPTSVISFIEDALAKNISSGSLKNLVSKLSAKTEIPEAELKQKLQDQAGITFDNARISVGGADFNPKGLTVPTYKSNEDYLNKSKSVGTMLQDESFREILQTAKNINLYLQQVNKAKSTIEKLGLPENEQGRLLSKLEPGQTDSISAIKEIVNEAKSVAEFIKSEDQRKTRVTQEREKISNNTVLPENIKSHLLGNLNEKTTEAELTDIHKAFQEAVEIELSAIESVKQNTLSNQAQTLANNIKKRVGQLGDDVVDQLLRDFNTSGPLTREQIQNKKSELDLALSQSKTEDFSNSDINLGAESLTEAIKDLSSIQKDITHESEEKSEADDYESRTVKELYEAQQDIVGKLQQELQDAIQNKQQRAERIVSSDEAKSVAGKDVSATVSKMYNILAKASLFQGAVKERYGNQEQISPLISKLGVIIKRALTSLGHVTEQKGLQGYIDNSGSVESFKQHELTLDSTSVSAIDESAQKLSEATNITESSILGLMDTLLSITKEAEEKITDSSKKIASLSFGADEKEVIRESNEFAGSLNKISQNMNDSNKRVSSTQKQLDGANSSLRRLGNQLKDTTKKTDQYSRTLSGALKKGAKKYLQNLKYRTNDDSVVGAIGTDLFGSTAGGLGAAATFMALKKLGSAIVDLGKQSMAAYGEIESIKTNLGVVYGSRSQSDMVFNDIAQYSVKSPFGVQQVAEFAVLLKQSGVYSSDLLDTLGMIGDVAGGNQEKFSRIANNYAQIVAAGKATSMDLRQFANAGLPIYQEIRKELGVSQKEVREMTQKGLVSASLIEKVFKNMTSEGGSFFNAVNLGAQTYKAKIQNLADKKQIGLATAGEWIYNLGIGDSTAGGETTSYFKKVLDVLENIYGTVDEYFSEINLEKGAENGEKTLAYIQSLQKALLRAESPEEKERLARLLERAEANFSQDKLTNDYSNLYQNQYQKVQDAEKRSEEFNDLLSAYNNEKNKANADYTLINNITEKLQKEYGYNAELGQSLLDTAAALNGVGLGLAAGATGMAMAAPATLGISAIPAAGVGAVGAITGGLGAVYGYFGQKYRDNNKYTRELQEEKTKLNYMKWSREGTAYRYVQAKDLASTSADMITKNSALEGNIGSLSQAFDELYKSTTEYQQLQERENEKKIQELQAAKDFQLKYQMDDSGHGYEQALKDYKNEKGYYSSDNADQLQIIKDFNKKWWGNYEVDKEITPVQYQNYDFYKDQSSDVIKEKSGQNFINDSLDQMQMFLDMEFSSPQAKEAANTFIASMYKILMTNFEDVNVGLKEETTKTGFLWNPSSMTTRSVTDSKSGTPTPVGQVLNTPVNSHSSDRGIEAGRTFGEDDELRLRVYNAAVEEVIKEASSMTDEQVRDFITQLINGNNKTIESFRDGSKVLSETQLNAISSIWATFNEKIKEVKEIDSSSSDIPALSALATGTKLKDISDWNVKSLGSKAGKAVETSPLWKRIAQSTLGVPIDMLRTGKSVASTYDVISRRGQTQNIALAALQKGMSISDMMSMYRYSGKVDSKIDGGRAKYNVAQLKWGGKDGTDANFSNFALSSAADVSVTQALLQSQEQQIAQMQDFFTKGFTTIEDFDKLKDENYKQYGYTGKEADLLKQAYNGIVKTVDSSGKEIVKFTDYATEAMNALYEETQRRKELTSSMVAMKEAIDTINAKVRTNNADITKQEAEKAGRFRAIGDKTFDNMDFDAQEIWLSSLTDALNSVNYNGKSDNTLTDALDFTAKYGMDTSKLEEMAIEDPQRELIDSTNNLADAMDRNTMAVIASANGEKIPQSLKNETRKSLEKNAQKKEKSLTFDSESFNNFDKDVQKINLKDISLTELLPQNNRIEKGVLAGIPGVETSESSVFTAKSIGQLVMGVEMLVEQGGKQIELSEEQADSIKEQLENAKSPDIIGAFASSVKGSLEKGAKADLKTARAEIFKNKDKGFVTTVTQNDISSKRDALAQAEVATSELLRKYEAVADALKAGKSDDAIKLFSDRDIKTPDFFKYASIKFGDESKELLKPLAVNENPIFKRYYDFVFGNKDAGKLKETDIENLSLIVKDDSLKTLLSKEIENRLDKINTGRDAESKSIRAHNENKTKLEKETGVTSGDRTKEEAVNLLMDYIEQRLDRNHVKNDKYEPLLKNAGIDTTPLQGKYKKDETGVFHREGLDSKLKEARQKLSGAFTLWANNSEKIANQLNNAKRNLDTLESAPNDNDNIQKSIEEEQRQSYVSSMRAASQARWSEIIGQEKDPRIIDGRTQRTFWGMFKGGNGLPVGDPFGFTNYKGESINTYRGDVVNPYTGLMGARYKTEDGYKYIDRDVYNSLEDKTGWETSYINSEKEAIALSRYGLTETGYDQFISDMMQNRLAARNEEGQVELDSKGFILDSNAVEDYRNEILAYGGNLEEFNKAFSVDPETGNYFLSSFEALKNLNAELLNTKEFGAAAGEKLTGMADTIAKTASSELFNGINESLVQMGKNLAEGVDSTEELGDLWKNVGKSILSSIGPTMMSTGLEIAAMGARSNSVATVVGGLALAAAGGVSSVLAGALSAEDDSDEDSSAEEQKIQNLKDALSDLIDQAKTDAEYYQKNLLHQNALTQNDYVATRSVNDAIITPSGSVVTTHPDDYLIATKTPGALGQKTASLSVNQVTNNYVSNEVAAETTEKQNADGSVDLITTVYKLVNKGLADGTFDSGMQAMQFRQSGKSVTN